MRFSVTDIMESGLTSKDQSEHQAEIQSRGDVLEFVETLEEEEDEANLETEG